AALAVLAAALALAACGSDDNDSEGSSNAGLPQGSEPVDLNPADFTTEIDNPYWPMTPGSRWVYKETDKKGTGQEVEVTVTDQTKTIANGIEARVVHDVVSEEGEPVEVTDDWYAQDSAGNVWYLGEDTAEYENGKVVSREGSFEAGVDGAQPGIAVPADPEVGLAYRQEYYAGQAEDKAKVLSLDAKASVPFGTFDGVLQTEDTNPLSKPKPEVEHKFYARDVGPVLALGVSGGGGRDELVSYAN
ncbi:MAG: hypothetical protein ACRDK5_05310, partial [Solirubrobacterales bacterium]